MTFFSKNKYILLVKRNVTDNWIEQRWHSRLNFWYIPGDKTKRSPANTTTSIQQFPEALSNVDEEHGQLKTLHKHAYTHAHMHRRLKSGKKNTKLSLFTDRIILDI